MKSASIYLVSLALLMCGCSSHNSTASGDRIPPDSQIAQAKPAAVTADTHFAAGQFAESQNQYAAALHQYNEALRLNPNHLPSLYRTGIVLTTLKKYDAAIKTWQRYMVASNNSGSAYNNLAYCYELQGCPKDAEATYKKGIAQDPRDAGCRTNYGLMLARRGQIQEAIRIWTPVLSDAEVHYNLAGIYQMDGRKQEAKVEYQRALDLDPSLPDAKERMTELDMNTMSK
jgi:tetratricopeptide (TPR) repeat protein